MSSQKNSLMCVAVKKVCWLMHFLVMQLWFGLLSLFVVNNNLELFFFWEEICGLSWFFYILGC